MISPGAPDVVIAGAGPAGATAALVLARAGVKVLLLDRARFPRSKLCGDTLNPGTLGLLRRLGLASATSGALPLEGMRLTGPGGVSVEARYPGGLHGVALTRCELDHRMLAAAVQAGAAFEERVTITGPLVDGHRDPRITGVEVRRHDGGRHRVPGAVTIAADGGASRLAAALGLSARPPAPRRWAIGAYYDGVAGLGPLGEMHVRARHYIGIAPLPGGRANAILVLPLAAARERGHPLPDLLHHAIQCDPLLAPRFTDARQVAPPVILGPLAIDIRRAAPPGLLLAGDAAGFIDPMTGDGMRFAIEGGELAARAAIAALEHGWNGVEQGLARDRRRAFRRKWRFNRTMRRLTASPLAVACIAACAPFAGPVLTRVITYAGDARG